ncbi:MAG TPA: protein kinase [Burkholderiaceae bacterium]|nr:protein kinase [Burkholderiaceae bacterium]
MTLSTEQLARMSRLLDGVVDLDEAGRRKWLQALPAQHRDLEPSLRHALFAHDGDAVDGAAVAMLSRIVLGGDAHGADVLQAGELVGPYRLVRLLGAGGMAEVWLAQRADGAFRREVALKIPTRLDRREDLAQRFVLERDILAGLEHPHIARFYDAGVSAGGKPYLALEYVAGKNLLQWADEHRLGVRARVELLLQGLDAVQYAHDKGVLHRDIKPNNLLVTEAGRVSLLDFGVAKLMERAEASDLTRVYGHALTPDYASPEQIAGGTIDAASDVYSLGVVLYQLLSGRRPYDDGARPGYAFLRPVEPPSTRLDAKAAEVRGGSVARVGRALRGDLDAIVLRALAPSPAGRYPSVLALGRDLRRYLAGEAVEAASRSALHRVGKLLSRHRIGIALAAVIAVALAAVGYQLLQRQPASRAPAAEGATASPTLPATSGNKSIVVLPFVDMSEKHDQEYFADGLSEELIDRLARSRNLRVIARTSAFAFKGRNEDVRSIAAELGVAYVLEGSVRKSEDVLRITAQLIRAGDGTSIWSQTYDRNPADVFKVQDEIARTVAHALETALIDRSALARIKEPSIEAYNLVLQGDVYTNGPFRRDAERAEVLFRKAIAIDPDYDLPWVRLANLYMREAYLSWAPKDEANAQARQAIEAALGIDPQSMGAHAAKFRYAVRVDYRWAEARAELERMRTIDPTDALHLPGCEAYFASLTGDLDEAVRIQTQIVDRDPLNSAAIGTLASYLLDNDRFELALTLWRRELALNPHAIGNHALGGVALALLGRPDAALDEIADERHDGYRLWAFSIALWLLGRKDESDAALEELQKHADAYAYYVAQLYAFRGETGRAFEWLNRACGERQSGCETLRSDRFLRSLRDDPRFKQLLARMKLEA